MKQSLLLLVVLGLLFSCTQTPKGYTVNGEIRGEFEEGTQVFLKKLGDDGQPVELDTTMITAGKFEFTGNADAPELHYIFIDKIPGYTALILENGTIDFNAQKDSLGFAKVKGTMQNEVFFDYLEKSRELSERARSIDQDMKGAARDEASVNALRDEMQELQEEYKNFEIDFIKSNPEALIAALLLDRALAMKAVETDSVQSMYNALSQEVKDSKPGKKVLEGLEKARSADEAAKSTAIGATAPNFSGPNPNGETITLKDVMGKVTLVDFWAAWCKPCRAENPNVVSVYNKYHDKGLNIVGVSLDRTAEAWKKAIADDGLEWNHISNIAYFDDQIAKLYNVNAIPAAFLLDENGVIVAKNLRGPALEAKVAELLD